MAKIISESGMDFIAENSFHIEESGAYRSIRHKGVRSVEFIRIKEDVLLLVEAKPSFPNPSEPHEDNKERFESEVNMIYEKFIHSLNLYSSIEVGITKVCYPMDFVIPEKVSLTFMLVLNNFKDEWCKPIKSELEEMLPSYIKEIWKPRIRVLTHQDAIEQGFVVSTE